MGAGFGGDLPQSYPLLDQIIAKGCPLALGLAMNVPLTGGTEHPPGINTYFAEEWEKWFWRYATKGANEPVKDEMGNILQSGNRRDVLAVSNLALYEAAEGRDSNPDWGYMVFPHCF